MRKPRTILVLCIIVCFLLTGCAAKHLPDGVSEEMVSERIEEIVSLLNAREYGKVIDSFRDDLESQASEEQLATAFDEKLDQMGGFIQIKETLIGGDTDMKTYEESAYGIVLCEYENGTAIYRIVFDSSLELIGVFMM